MVVVGSTQSAGPLVVADAGIAARSRTVADCERLPSVIVRCVASVALGKLCQCDNSDGAAELAFKRTAVISTR